MRDEVGSLESESFVESPFDNVELLHGLSAEEVRELLRAGHRRVFEPGEALFREGDEADSLFFVEVGELDVHVLGDLGDVVHLARLGAGEVVGEMAILDRVRTRSATVEAISEVAVIELKRDTLDTMRTQNTASAYKFILNLARVIVARRRRTDARVAEVFSEPERHIEAFETQVHELLGRIRKA